MDPTKKDWLSAYFDLARSEHTAYRLGDLTVSQRLYRALHACGIIFGHPIKIPLDIAIDLAEWPVEERIQLIMAESFMTVFLSQQSALSLSNTSLEKAMDSFLKWVEIRYPKMNHKGINPFAKPSKTLQFERFLKQHIQVKGEWNAQFWRGYFQNSKLFVDLLVYQAFLQNEGQQSTEQLAEKHLQIHWRLLLKINSGLNKMQLEDQEKSKILHPLIDAMDLSKSERNKAQNHLSNRKEMEVGSLDWLSEKFINDNTALCLWASGLEIEKHLQSLEDSTELISFLQSLLSIESFVIHNWGAINHLQSKQSYQQLGVQFSSHLKQLLQYDLAKIKNGIAQAQALNELLSESQKRALSSTEYQSIRQQLLDIITPSELLSYIPLPLLFLTASTLLKSIPDEAFGVDFSLDKIVQRRGNRVIN
jgi:hypothetical protein